MNNYFFRRLVAVAVTATTLTGLANAAPANKPKPSGKPKAPVKAQPKLGIKQTPQMAGGVGRFGELYALKSGWTLQIIGARYSYDAFDDYNQLYPQSDQKLLVLQIAIKNNTPEDNFFNADAHQFQIYDTDGQLYSGGAYRLNSAGAQGFAPTLKPGQGAGQSADNRLEVAIPIAEKAQVAKIIIQQGRKGATEDVIRFFIAGTPDGDPKNVVASPAGLDASTPLKPGVFVPSRYYQFRINGVTFAPGPIANNEAPENRRFAIVNLTLKNATTTPHNIFDFIGDSIDKQIFTDADGETYPASGDIGLLKASADEQTSGDFAPGQEKTLRLIFPVPQTGELKTLTMGASASKQWTFDASGWK